MSHPVGDPAAEVYVKAHGVAAIMPRGGSSVRAAEASQAGFSIWIEPVPGRTRLSGQISLRTQQLAP